MKLGKPRRERRAELRAADIRGEMEDPDLLVFHPEDFFTPEEWSNLANKLLDNLKNSDREKNEWFRVENFLSSSFALQFLRPEQLQIIRGSQETKGLVRAAFAEKEDIHSLDDEELDAAVMTLWLFPDIDLPIFTEAWEDLKDRAKRHPNPLNPSMVFLLKPSLKQELPLGDDWLHTGEAKLADMKQDDHADPFTALRLAMSLRLAYPFQGERKVLAAKRIKQRLLEGDQLPVPARDPLELVLNIHTAAVARITLAEKVEIKDGQFIIHDAPPKLPEKLNLPVRSQV